MNKKIIVFMLLLQSFKCISVSFKTGYTKTYQYFKNYNKIYSNNHTLNIGTGFSFDLNDVYSLNFNTLFNFSVYCKKFLNEQDAVIIKTPIMSFELPVYVGIDLDDRIKIFSGVYVWIPVKYSQKSVDYPQETKTFNVEYNDYFSGGIFIGGEYKIKNISVEARYKYGFKTFYKTPVVYDNDFTIFFNVYF